MNNDQIQNLRKAQRISLIVACVGWLVSWWILLIALIVAGVLFIIIFMNEEKSKTSNVNIPTDISIPNDVGNETIGTRYEKHMSMLRVDNVTEIQFDKISRVIFKISQKQNTLDERKRILSSRDDEVSLLENAKLLLQIALLDSLCFHIVLVANGVKGSEEIVIGLRREFGDNWYYKWENLINDDSDNEDKYIVGLSYEIVYGTADETII